MKQQKCVHHVIRSYQEALSEQLKLAGRGREYARGLLEDFRSALQLHQRYQQGYCTLEEYQREGESLSAQIEQRLRKSCRSKENRRLQKGLRKHHERGNLLRFLADPRSSPPIMRQNGLYVQPSLPGRFRSAARPPRAVRPSPSSSH